MKVCRVLICLGFAVAGGNICAQETSTSNQLNRLRFLQNLISFADGDLPKEKEWKVTLNSGISCTTNATLVPDATEGDIYATNILSARWQRDAGDGLGVSAGVSATDFRYVRFPWLSMSFFDGDAGFTWSGTVAGLEAEGYLSQTLEWTQQKAVKSQSFSSIMALGGSFSRQFRPGQTVSLMPALSATPYAWPSTNAYACASLSTSYEWMMGRGITLGISTQGYVTGYFAGERDFTMSCTASATWAITSWLSASAFASPAWNFSSTAGSNYMVLDTGITVSGIWQF